MYGNNKIILQKNNEVVWEQDEKIKSISQDLDGNILIVNADNKIEKKEKETGKLIWKLDQEKGTFKLSSKQKLSNVFKIVPISNNEYKIITENKLITIKLNLKKKKITSFKTEKNNLLDFINIDRETNTYLKTKIEDNTTIIQEESGSNRYITIETSSLLSTITKK